MGIGRSAIPSHEEVEMAVREWRSVQELLTSTVTELLDLCQGGENAAVCLGIVVENGDTSLETTSYVQRCNEPWLKYRQVKTSWASFVRWYGCSLYRSQVIVWQAVSEEGVIGFEVNIKTGPFLTNVNKIEIHLTDFSLYKPQSSSKSTRP